LANLLLWPGVGLHVQLGFYVSLFASEEFVWDKETDKEKN